MKIEQYANALVIAGFFVEGLHDAGYDKVLKAWDRGCYELINEISSYASYTEA
jgi:hypothetical protein